MNLSEIYELLEQANNGKPKMELYRKAWEIADQCHNYKEQIMNRYQYMYEAAFFEDMMEIYLILPEMLKLHDRHMEEFGEDNNIIHILWAYKWVLENAVDFYQITVDQFESFCEDYEKRCIAAGYSLRAYYTYRFCFYKNGDLKKAEDSYKKYLKCVRDEFSDCEACERNLEVGYLLERGMEEKARERAKPLFRGMLTCVEVPEVTYGSFLRYFDLQIAQGKVEYIQEAEQFVNKVMHAIKHKDICKEYVGDVFMFYVLTESSKALNFYKQYWRHFEENRNPIQKLYFAMAAVRFFDLLKDRTTYKISLASSFPLYKQDNIYEVDVLRKYYEDYAVTLCEKLDKRNGNQVFGEKYQILVNCFYR